jgi:hypothetical protein
MPRPKVRPENRQRVSRACLACKASKIRCDSQQPCAACVRREHGSSCVYSGTDYRRRHHRISQHSTNWPRETSPESVLSSGRVRTPRIGVPVQNTFTRPATSDPSNDGNTVLALPDDRQVISSSSDRGILGQSALFSALGRKLT